MAETVPKGALNNAQDAVTSVENWSRENHMKLHPGKCRGRTLIGGGGVYIHIFGLCPTNFPLKSTLFQKKLVGRNLNI